MADIVTCPSCGRRNRLPLAGTGRARCAACHTDLPWVVDVSEAGFADAVERSTLPVLVDVWAPWCGPCRTVGPLVEELGRDLAGRLKVAKVNADTAPGISARHGISGIPTLLFYAGGRELGRLVGAHPRPALRRWVDGQLAAAEPGRTAGARG